MANKFYLNGACYDVCPDNFYPSKAMCETCDPSCMTCTGTWRRPPIAAFRFFFAIFSVLIKGKANTDCLVCASGFQYINGRCLSNCPDGTYYDVDEAECVLCNSTLCDWCVEKPWKCLKCAYPLVLDRSTYTCKTCCTRSNYGSLTGDSCCNCPENGDYTGYCIADNDDDKDAEVIYPNSTLNTIYNSVLKKIEHSQDSASMVILAMFMFIISILFSIFAFKILKSARQYKTSKSEYKPLIEANNDDANGLALEHDDYELNNNDIKGFVGKIKPTKTSRVSSQYRYNRSGSVEEKALMTTDL